MKYIHPNQVDKVHSILLNHDLSLLIGHLDDKQYMKEHLIERFALLQRHRKPIPADLDWVYCLYNITTTNVILPDIHPN